MRRLVKDDGRVLVSFGPPWCHPLGGHLFSIFPWAHLIFTERALMRWWSDFKSDGATRFSEVEGGLNQMTVRRARQLLERAFAIERFEAAPIPRVRRAARGPPPGTFTTDHRASVGPAPPAPGSPGGPPTS